MSQITKGLNNSMGAVLTSLDQEPLSDLEAVDALQDTIDNFNKPSFDYKEDIDFDNDDDIKQDLMIARNMIMETIDKSKKISDAVINTLVVDTANPTFLQLAQEANRTIQQSVRSLSDIHSAYIKIRQSKVRTDLMGNGSGGKNQPESESNDGVTFE